MKLSILGIRIITYSVVGFRICKSSVIGKSCVCERSVVFGIMTVDVFVSGY